MSTDRINELEEEVKRLKTLLASASIALYGHTDTWQQQVRSSLAKTYAKASEHLAGEIIERIEGEE